MRTNNMKLETLETFTVRLACGFASTVLLLLLLGLAACGGLRRIELCSGVTAKDVLVSWRSQ